MRSTFYITASALATLASAQTFTDCNPMEKECPNNPAIAQDFETDFTAGKDAVKGWKQTAGSLNYVKGGAEFTVAKKGDAPTIQSEGYFHFGYVEVKTSAAPGQGIISSIVLESDDLDEVDWEFVGSVGSKVQMNYFGKGNTTTYDRMIQADVSDAQSMHTYGLNWTQDALTWIIDSKVVRTLKYADANGGKNFPQTPCNVRIGIWAGGDSENEGTREWAGGAVDYSKAPFTQTVQSVKITNYSPGKEYKWTDKSGSYKSIQVIEPGNKDGAPQNSAKIEPSATASGAGVGSDVNAPTQTGAAASGKPAESTPCSEGESQPQTPAPTPSPSAPSGNGPSPPGESSCDCGVLTVTVTGTPPPAESTPAVPVPPTTPQVPSGGASSPPPQSTPVVPPTTPQVPSGGVSSPVSPPPQSTPVVPPTTPEVPPTTPQVPSGGASSSPCTTDVVPPQSTAPVSPPQVSTPAGSAPPYPTGGIMTATSPAPSVPFPSAPSGAIPSGNASTTGVVPFPGAASHNTAGALFGLVGVVMFFFA